MAVAVGLTPPLILQFFNNLGQPNAGGTLLTQVGGVNYPTYQDSGGTTPLPNPIPLNSRGEVSNAVGTSCQMFLQQGVVYTMTLFDAAGNQLDTFSYVTSPTTSATTLVYTPPAGFGGATTVAAELNGLVGMAARNAIYNGNFDAALNAGPLALPASGAIAFSTVDAWAVFQVAASAGISAQVASTLTAFKNFLKIGRNSASSSTNIIGTQQAIRTVDSIPLQGKNVVLSFYAQAGANFSGANLSVKIFTGTGTDEGVANMASWTGVATPLSTTQVITASPTQYSFTATIASTATEIGVQLQYTPSGTAGADDNVYLTGVSLQIGVVATPQDNVPFLTRLPSFRPYTPCCARFSVLGGSNPFTKVHLVPYNGNLVMINGVPQVVPNGVLSVNGGVQATLTSCSVDGVPATSLVANTLYEVYVFMVAGVMTLDFHATVNNTPTYIVDPNYGIWVKSGHPEKTLVGLIMTDTSAVQLQSSQNQSTAVSRYYPIRYILSQPSINGTTNTTSYTNIGTPVKWVQFSDDIPTITLQANLGDTTANNRFQMGIQVQNLNGSAVGGSVSSNPCYGTCPNANIVPSANGFIQFQPAAGDGGFTGYPMFLELQDHGTTGVGLTVQSGVMIVDHIGV